MNDESHSELEARLRAWRPAEVPAALQSRLLAAGPPPRRGNRRRRALLAAACALAVGIALLSDRDGRSPDPGDGTATPPGHRRTGVAETFAEPRWMLGESLTMNIDTGVPPGIMPAAWRLDGEFVDASGLLPVRSPDGKLPLKVDCQF